MGQVEGFMPNPGLRGKRGIRHIRADIIGRVALLILFDVAHG